MPFIRFCHYFFMFSSSLRSCTLNGKNDLILNVHLIFVQIPTDTEEDIPVGEKTLKQPVSYNEVTPEQAHELAQASEFCLQVGLLHYMF